MTFWKPDYGGATATRIAWQPFRASRCSRPHYAAFRPRQHRECPRNVWHLACAAAAMTVTCARVCPSFAGPASECGRHQYARCPPPPPPPELAVTRLQWPRTRVAMQRVC